jgi:hypothetical protein
MQLTSFGKRQINKNVKGVFCMLKKAIYYLFLMFVVTGCATGVNEPLDNNGQDNNNSQSDIDLKMGLEVSEEENATNFKFTVKNNAATDAVLEFSSGQQFEVTVMNENGEEVYRFSEGRVFTQAFQNLTIPAGESVEWLDSWKHDDSISTGKYEVKVKIVALTINGKSFDPKMLVVSDEISVEKPEKVTIPDNNAFRNIEVDNNGKVFTITGEARVFEAVFQYEVIEEGNVILSSVETVTEGAPSWSPFTLSLDLNNVIIGDGEVVLELFVYSANDGSKENILTVPLQ